MRKRWRAWRTRRALQKIRSTFLRLGFDLTSISDAEIIRAGHEGIADLTVNLIQTKNARGSALVYFGLHVQAHTVCYDAISYLEKVR